MTGNEIKRLAAMLREELRLEMDELRRKMDELTGMMGELMDTMDETDELMSMKQAAEHLDCTTETLRKRCERGLPHHKKDGVIVFSRKEIDNYYKERKKKKGLQACE